MNDSGNQWGKMIKKLSISLILIITAIIGFGALGTTPDNIDMSCITVYIDNGNGQPQQTCYGAAHDISGLSALLRTGHYVEGTQKYPDQVICRLDGFPTYKTEPCLTMPNKDSYWAILVKKNGKWDWAQTGIQGVILKPGEGIGFVFTNKGKVTFPK